MSMDGEKVKSETVAQNMDELVSGMRSDVKSAREHLAKMEVQVSHLPSKGFWAGMLLALTLISAIIVWLA